MTIIKKRKPVLVWDIETASWKENPQVAYFDEHQLKIEQDGSFEVWTDGFNVWVKKCEEAVTK